MHQKVVLKLSHSLVDKPVLYRLVKDYNLMFNLLKASITPEESGILVVELAGNDEDFKNAMAYLKEIGVGVAPLEKDIVRSEEKCTSCGTCLAVCPVGALYIDKNSWKVLFDKEKCIACELCITICPPRAMEIHF